MTGGTLFRPGCAVFRAARSADPFSNAAKMGNPRTKMVIMLTLGGTWVCTCDWLLTLLGAGSLERGISFRCGCADC